MAYLSRKRQETANIWPGWVDALSSLLMVVIFVLMIFMVAQFYLSNALTGRDQELARLNQKISDLATLLELEQAEVAAMRDQNKTLLSQLEASIGERDEIASLLATVQREKQNLEDDLQSAAGGAGVLQQKLAAVRTALVDAEDELMVEKERVALKLAQIAKLENEVLALQALKKSLSEDLQVEKQGNVQAQAELARLNQQLAALTQQLSRLEEALEVAESLNKEREVEIAELGRRLNLALASKVEQLARYRSDFFGKLRDALGDRDDIRIEGDRFVFQSEVLFPSASDQLNPEGQETLQQLAATLSEMSQTMPEDINWILRVDGHTDARPIQTERFPSNWELSAARAISVVKFLSEAGIAKNRLVAAGFGEFQPLETGRDELSFARNRRIEFKLDQR